MLELSSTQKKVLDIYHNDGHVKAWNYWKLMGNTYGIFLGEVPSSEIIYGESLAKHIGLTEGFLCNIDTPWLKFILDSNMIYVPMNPLMHSVPWNEINKCGAVFENEGVTIEIGSDTYDITLLRGLNKNHNPHERYYGYDINQAHNSEWNRLMYPIHSGVHDDSNHPSTSSIPYARWATYNDKDLVTYHECGKGSATWMQEVVDDYIRILRGNVGVTYVYSSISSNTNTSRGWRPALRLINND